MTTGFIQPRSMDIFFLIVGPNKRIKGLCGPPACWMMRIGGERHPHPPPPFIPTPPHLQTPPKEHQSQHCCGTVGSFELSLLKGGDTEMNGTQDEATI